MDLRYDLSFAMTIDWSSILEIRYKSARNFFWVILYVHRR